MVRILSNGDTATLPNSTIEVGENGIGVYTEGGNGDLNSGSIKSRKRWSRSICCRKWWNYKQQQIHLI